MRLRLLFADWSETGRRSDVILFWLEHLSTRNIRRLHVKMELYLYSTLCLYGTLQVELYLFYLRSNYSGGSTP
jgi:hypothetical protein